MEFNRLRRDLERSCGGAPVSEPFRVGSAYKPPTQEEEDWAKATSNARKEVKRQSEASIQRVIDMYGTDDFFRTDEMGKSGELTAWLVDRFGTANFSQIDRLLKSGEYGDRKKVGYDEDQYNDLSSPSDIKFRPVAMTMGNKTVLRGRPCLAPPDDDPPTDLRRNDVRAGSSATHPLVAVSENVSESDGESATDDEPYFRAGGRNRVAPCSRIESAKSDDGDDGSEESNADLFPSPDGATFATAETERPSFNPTFDAIPPYCVSNFRPGVLCSDPDFPM